MAKQLYRLRWGQERRRATATHPLRKARQVRAYARGASLPGDKPNATPSKAKAARKEKK